MSSPPRSYWLVDDTPSHQRGKRHGHDQGASVEDLLDPAAQAEQLETGDPGDQEVDGDDRAPRVETPRVHDGRPEERGCERREQVRRGDAGLERAERAREDHAGERAEEAGGDDRPQPDAVDTDAREP